MFGDKNKGMQEQEINNHCSPPAQQQQQIPPNQQLHTGTISSSISAAIRSQRLVHRYLPPSSLAQQSCSPSSSLLLYKAQPIFRLESSIYDRQRLSMERQLMYCRGVAEELSCDDIVEELIKESQCQKGYINKKGNTSIIINQLLVYAHQSSINALQLPKHSNNLLEMYHQTLAPITLLIFPLGTDILQLQPLTHSYTPNNKRNSQLISIRLSRQVVIFNLLSSQIVSKISTQSSSEFIATIYNNHINGPNALQTLQYDGHNTIIKLWQLNNSNPPLPNSSILIQKTLVHSLAKLTNNSRLLASYDGLRLHDYRLNKLTTQYITSPQERLYSIQRLTGQYTYSPYIATSHTRYVSLFDIRKLSSPIVRRPHHCEQSPHDNMIYFDGCLERLNKPVIMYWSPYDNGSTLMIDVNLSDTDGFRSSKQVICSGNNTILGNNNGTIDTMLLGKHFNILPHRTSSPNNNDDKLPLYTNSISLHNYSPSSLAVFAISNIGTINMHMYNHSQDGDNYCPQQIQEYEEEQTSKSKQQVYTTYQWFQNNLHRKYFSKNRDYHLITSLQQKPSTSKTKNKKKNDQKNHRRKSTKDGTKSILSTSLKSSHQEQQLLQSQFQNEDSCQQNYHKRKLNFVDLTTFYQTLSNKAKQFSIFHIDKLNQIEFSLTSTQPYSENYSLSQSFSDDSFTTTNILSKKTINSSLFGNLKSHWDQ